MADIQTQTVQCPYCGENNELEIDTSIEEQEFVEDCQICCQPMLVRATSSEGEVVAVEVRREND